MSAGAAQTTGYLHGAYAASVSPGCWARELPRSGGWIVERPIERTPEPGGDLRDAMGSYPLLCCRSWPALAADLDALAAGADGGNDGASREGNHDGADLISLVAVTDPFGDHAAADLRAAFPDRVVPFKEHLVADLSHPFASFVSPHHRRYARAAARALDVERCAAPGAWLDDWCALYDVLCARHAITGVAAFSRASFAAQLAVPGVELFRAAAVAGGETVGMLLWYRQGDVAYYHLGAYSDRGYAMRASFPLFWLAFEHFASAGVRWLGLGAGAGLGDATDAQADGLVRFKRGWATETRLTYLCGRILQPRLYHQLVRACAAGATSFFPAYRSPLGTADTTSPAGGASPCDLAV